jgi:hypothetical protein
MQSDDGKLALVVPDTEFDAEGSVSAAQPQKSLTFTQAVRAANRLLGAPVNPVRALIGHFVRSTRSVPASSHFCILFLHEVPFSFLPRENDTPKNVEPYHRLALGDKIDSQEFNLLTNPSSLYTLCS